MAQRFSSRSSFRVASYLGVAFLCASAASPAFPQGNGSVQNAINSLSPAQLSELKKKLESMPQQDVQALMQQVQSGQQQLPSGMQQQMPSGMQQQMPSGMQQQMPSGMQQQMPSGAQQQMPSGAQQQVPFGMQHQGSGRHATGQLEFGRDAVEQSPVTGFINRTQLRPFGEKLMAGGGEPVRTLDIPVPGDYQIGPGDTVLLQLFGKENRSYTLPVTRDGNIQIPDIGPLQVTGMSFELMSQTVLERISKQKIGVEASITMGPLRSIQIFLVGDVKNPGAYTTPALTTVTNALLAAGGVRQSGSLRRIEVRREGRTVTRLDVYEVLLRGDVRGDLRLQPGDVIFVPPTGPRVAISGEVNRPAIYELLNERNAGEVLRLAGGLLPTAFAGGGKLQRLMPDDTRRVIDVSLAPGKQESVRIQDGDLIEIPMSIESIRSSVRLEGALLRPGAYEWRQGIKLGDIISSPHLLRPTTWRMLAILERVDQVTGIPSYIPVNLVDELRGRGSVELRAEDRLFLFDDKDIEFLASPNVQKALQGQALPKACPAVRDLASIVAREGVERFRTALLLNKDVQPDTAACSETFVTNPKLLPVVLEHASVIRGEVKAPGFIVAAPGVSLHDAITASGGFTREADLEKIEISRPLRTSASVSTIERKVLKAEEMAAATLVAGDVVLVRKRFNELDSGAVIVRGEVANPGAFDIRRGEKLSQVLLRAGGLTTNAYPYGAVFERSRIRDEKKSLHQRTAIEMQNAMLLMMARQKRTSGAGGGDPAMFAAMRSLIDDLKGFEPTGRIVVEADPTVLQVSPELDVVLEPGDVISIPKRPSHIAVMGEVLNPGAVQFKSGLRAEDYLRAAGGISMTGDESRTYMILPNGSAEPLKVASWNAQPTPIPPGSVIYVPRDPLPLDNTTLLQTVLEIAKDIALTGAALVNISR